MSRTSYEGGPEQVAKKKVLSKLLKYAVKVTETALPTPEADGARDL